NISFELAVSPQSLRETLPAGSLPRYENRTNPGLDAHWLCQQPSVFGFQAAVFGFQAAVIPGRELRSQVIISENDGKIALRPNTDALALEHFGKKLGVNVADFHN